MLPKTCDMTYIKICGITNIEDALAAATLGADLLGFIFFASSPRYILPERASEIIAELRQRGVTSKLVGVFVNESLERVRRVMEQTQVDLVQLHGSEPPAMVQELGQVAFKSLRPRDHGEAKSLIANYHLAVNGNTPAFIVDAFSKMQFGGTGDRVDWTIAAEIAREFPILLAGGLNPGNVAEAIRTVQPWGVDVSSGVERAPGLKDQDKVREFIRNAKA